MHGSVRARVKVPGLLGQRWGKVEVCTSGTKAFSSPTAKVIAAARHEEQRVTSGGLEVPGDSGVSEL